MSVTDRRTWENQYASQPYGGGGGGGGGDITTIQKPKMDNLSVEVSHFIILCPVISI